MTQNKATAAILYEINKPLVLQEITLPALKRGQVLVKIFYSGVCQSQVMECRGGRGNDPWLPHMLGHEGAGQVVAIGDDVKKVSVGDEVILGWLRGDGIEAPGAIYYAGKIPINSGRVTTFSNFSIVSESRVYKMPKGLSYSTAVLFGCALPTGAGMVLNELKPKLSDTVAVIGLGGIGISALMALVALEIKQIIAIDVSPDKLELAKKLGAGLTINPLRNNVAEVIFEHFPKGVDACLESAGSTSTIELGFSIIKKEGGYLLFASHPPEGEMIRLLPHELISGKRISGSWGGASHPDQDIPRINQVLEKSGSSLDVFIKDVYPLSSINNAINDLANGSSYRPLIKMPHNY